MTRLGMLLLGTCGALGLSGSLQPAAYAAVPGPDVGVAMTDAPDPVALYGTITYTISVTNHDSVKTATGVSVTDTLIDDPTLQVAGLVPSVGSTITSASSTYARSSCTVSAPPTQLPQVPPATSYYTTPWKATCSLGSLPPATTATVTVTVMVHRTNTLGVYAPNPVVNTVRIASTSGDPNPTNNAAQSDTCVVFPSRTAVCSPVDPY